ncbi:MAG: GNAT family N-acetyltransferase [Neomegalonema sp.]|nr:GNAT family N-acetyltransferase [Neomegalonema sp.]
MFARIAPPMLYTERLRLRPLRQSDFAQWTRLRRSNQSFLAPWEPAWHSDHLSPGSFRRRVRWAGREISGGRAVPLGIFYHETGALIGGITLEHIRHGAAQSAALGYWLGREFTGAGFMTEALQASVAYAFDDLDLSRLEAACLPENAPSRRLLERCGFHEEATLSHYLQINGVWRDHVLYERRRSDRI